MLCGHSTSTVGDVVLLARSVLAAAGTVHDGCNEEPCATESIPSLPASRRSRPAPHPTCRTLDLLADEGHDWVARNRALAEIDPVVSRTRGHRACPRSWPETVSCDPRPLVHPPRFPRLGAVPASHRTTGRPPFVARRAPAQVGRPQTAGEPHRGEEAGSQRTRHRTRGEASMMSPGNRPETRRCYPSTGRMALSRKTRAPSRSSWSHRPSSAQYSGLPDTTGEIFYP
jgi:hypothetical protein